MIGLVLNENRVVDLKARDKEGAIQELVGVLSESSKVIKDPKSLVKALLDREKILSTGIGLGIAVPHARLETIDRIVMAVGRQMAGIPFDSIDGKPVYLVFVIVGPDAAQRNYLKLLARIVQVIKRPKIRKRLLEASDASGMYQILKNY
jgi:nitrogen PTS system EIIA component